MKKLRITKMHIFLLSLIAAVFMTAAFSVAALDNADTETISTIATEPVIHMNIIVCDNGKENNVNVPVGIKVKKALDYLNLNLSDDDTVNANLNDTVYPGQKLIISRVYYSIYPEHKEIKYNTVVQYSDELLKGKEKILQKGKNGGIAYIYEDKYVNGEITSHAYRQKKILTYPVDKIIVRGTRSEKDNNASSKHSNSLITTEFDDNKFKLPQIKLDEKNRDLLERIVTGEFGSSYIGACLIAQSIKCAMVYDGYTSIADVIKGMGYVGSTSIGKSQNAINAVKLTFDQNGLAVKHRLFYMCTDDYYKNNPGNFHSTQNFILQYENVLFFDRW